MLVPPAPLNAFFLLFNRGEMFTPLNFYPVAPADGTGAFKKTAERI
jgi:hypothetical protein